MGNNPFARTVHSHNPLRNCADFVVSYSFDQTRETNCLLRTIATGRQSESCEISIFHSQKKMILEAPEFSFDDEPLRIEQSRGIEDVVKAIFTGLVFCDNHENNLILKKADIFAI